MRRLTLTPLWSAKKTLGPVLATSTYAGWVAFAVLFLGAGMMFVQPCAGASGVFENTGSLATARFGHTATLLPNGMVLVAGGEDSGGSFTSLASAELYDPASETWSATGSLATARQLHTATLLPNGKVLVAGGFNNRVQNGLASAELYDPASGTWTATSSLGAPRFFHTATLLPNGTVLVAGGEDTNGSLGSVELYDPANGTWTATGSLATARAIHTATLLPNGKVLVTGGVGSGSSLASAELYDPASGIWTGTGNLGAPRYFHTATLLPNGKVLVAGGEGTGSPSASAELYDPASGTWTGTGNLGAARYSHTATLLPNGKVLVSGGESNGISLASAELYDPASETTTATGSLTTARTDHTGTLLPNGKVLAVGGYTGISALASAELYVGQSTLLNISARMRVLTGDNVLISGFIITGTDLKRVLIRGLGPSLNGAGITLSDPTLELHQQGRAQFATNDNWKIDDHTGRSQEAAIRSTTIPPPNDSESAILLTLGPGTYTAILAGKNKGTGMGLVEVYDLAQDANSKLANMSTRGFAETDDNLIIGGFIIDAGGGRGTAKVIVRAIGPSLSVAGALGDPTLELHDGSGTMIATNDNWKTRPDGTSQQAEIEATTIPPANDLESAVVATLVPGNYTAIVRGKNNTTGVGVVEVYDLQ
jgi:N-acetylneuraminic acid mutarotase